MTDFLHHGYLTLPKKRPRPIDLLCSYFRIYPGASPCDRTGTIAFPTRMKSIFPMPGMRNFSPSYADLCSERAEELWGRANGRQIYIAWSGGVDSTCALVSLLQQFSKAADYIVVLCDENSIREYPLFFNRVIRGRLQCAPAALWTEMIGTPNLLVNGECNDQLFGSDVLVYAIEAFGIEAAMAPYSREFLTSLFQIRLKGDRESALFFSGLLSRLRETSPVSLPTNFDMLWWINFALKWQCVQMRPLIFAKGPITREYVTDFYHPFYNTPRFQLWSMNNLDKRIKDTWASYKWPAKEVIFNYTQDPIYRDRKTKYGSLQHLMFKLPFHQFLDENFAFRQEMDWYRPQNDFA